MQPPARICLTYAFQFNTEKPCKSDDAMFLPLAKAMRLRRDVCLRHVADNKLSLHGIKTQQKSTRLGA